LKEILDEMENVFLVQSTHLGHMLAYDMTFEMGDFYVSFGILKNSPCIPFTFLLHERILTKFHENGALKIPSLSKANDHAIITDRE